MSVKLLTLLCLVLVVVRPVVCDGVEKGMVMPVESRDKRSDDAGPLEAVVDKLTQQVTLLNAQLNAQVNSLNSEIAVLKNKTDTLGKNVAFYAWNKAHPIHTAAYGTLVFDHAQTNVGNAYSPLTGVFTAPVSGLYHFQTTFMSISSGKDTYAAIYIGNTEIAEGISDTRHGYWDQTTISSIVHVSAGQHVYVKNIQNSAIDYHAYTSFSGFLLRAD